MISTLRVGALALFTLAWSAPALAAPPKPPKPPRPATPVAPVKQVRKQIVIKKGGDSPHTMVWVGGKGGYLGVQLVALTDELREHFGAPKEAGVMVSRVEADTPAAKAGVRVGDIITAVDGEAVSHAWELARRVRKKEDGQSAKLTLIRDRKRKTVNATVAVRERKAVDVTQQFMFHSGDDFDFQGDFDIEVEVEGLPDFERLPHLEHFDLEKIRKMKQHEKKLEQRMRELEKKLEKLEKKLQGRRLPARDRVPT